MYISKKWLIDRHACQAGLGWFNAQDKRDAKEVLYALAAAGHSEWVSWLLNRIAKTKRQRVQIAVFSAECVLPIYEKNADSDAPRKAIAAAKAYLKSPSAKTKIYAKCAAAAAAAAAAYAKKKAIMKIIAYSVELLGL